MHVSLNHHTGYLTSVEIMYAEIIRIPISEFMFLLIQAVKGYWK